MLPEDERRQLAMRAREHVLAHHTAAHRACTLESYVEEALRRANAAARAIAAWPRSREVAQRLRYAR